MTSKEIVSSKVYDLFGTPVLPLWYRYGFSDCMCLLPLKYVGGSSIEKSPIMVCPRKPQPSRGKYFQTNEGFSVHVDIYKKYMAAEQRTTAALGGAWTSNHVSHLCHHWWCCNPEHLVEEPDFVNIMRKSCPSPRWSFDDILRADCQCVDLVHPKLIGAPSPCLWYTPAKVKELDLVNDGLDPTRLPGDQLKEGDFDGVKFYIHGEKKNQFKSATWNEVKAYIEGIVQTNVNSK